MEQEEIYYKAMLSRDYRFDGKFYIAVKTTGIYCRPICPAKPKFENVEFFQDAISAEKAGYRPCLRCHPEFAPEYPSLLGKSPIVQKALQQISQNALLDVEAFAMQFGVSSRHLRRLFENEVGMSPKELSDHHRLNFASKLIQETTLDLTQIAFASGFNSLRRFNDAFKKRYRHPPSVLRKGKATSDNSFTLHLSYRPPLDWKSLLLYYANHQIPYLEKVTQDSYERVFKEGYFTVQNDEKKAQIELKVFCQDPKVLFPIVNRVRQMFDLNSDPIFIYNQFSKVPFLKELWEGFPGLRLAQGWDPFEIAMGTILGQVVSMKRASQMMGELVTHYGEIKPEVLAVASLDEIKTTGGRKQAIRDLCKAILNNEISLSSCQNLQIFKENLRKIKGIGHWSAEYISLRGLGDTNAFPKEDLVLKRALKACGHQFNLQQLEPWKSYLAIYLWRKYGKQTPEV